MVDISLKLLGNPKIFLNGQEQFFTFSKVNALLYYLAINGSANREVVASLLWENKSTQTAKKNLRNTIYQANKGTKADIIICPNRNTITLNPDLNIKTDVELFLKSPKHHLDLYQGDFLQGFYLKNCEEFEVWISKLRLQYEQIFLKASYQKVEEGLSLDNEEDNEQYLKQLIERDEYEERHYQLLMRFYQQQKRPSKAIETYYQLTNLLEKELSIQPSNQSQQIYQEILANHRNDCTVSHFLRTSDTFLGRSHEIRQLETFLASCLTNHDAEMMLLIGDTGIGKRTLAKQVLAAQSSRFQMVTAECFREEYENPFQLWRTLLNHLGDLVIQHRLLTPQGWKMSLKQHFTTILGQTENDDHLVLSKQLNALSYFLVDILQQLAAIKPMVILIEDIHWIDQGSLSILQKVIHQVTDSPLAFIFTKHPGTPIHLENYLNALTSQKKLQTILLEPFTRQESFDFIHSQLSDQTIDPEELERLYQVSQGIPFFLSEYTKLLINKEKFVPLTPAIKAKLGLKLANLDSLANELLNLLACCPQAVPLNTLAQVMSVPLEEIIAIVDNLCSYYILIESNQDDDIVINFRKQIVRLYCYDRLSKSRKQLLHGQIAKRLEERLAILPPTPKLLQEIAYHFDQSHQDIKALEYSLNYLDNTLDYQHELFPIYSKYSARNELSTDDNQRLIEKQFKNIQQRIDYLETRYENNRDFQELVVRFSYLEGRYDIRIGRYQEGIKHIQKVIALATDLKQSSFLLEGYRQLIHYCIQVENKVEMKYYSETSLEAAVAANHFEAIAISLRFKGLYHLIIGDLDEAKRLLRQSIDFFKVTPSLESQYTIQIAAALDYLAEIYQIKQEFDKAIHYQQTAIKLTEKADAEVPASVFYIGLGISYFIIGQLDTSEQMLVIARQGLKKHLRPWKEIQLDIYLAIIQWKKGVTGPVIDLLRQRDKLESRYGNPRDKGFIYYVMAVVKYHLLTAKQSLSETDCDYLEATLIESFDRYYEIAMANLNPYRDKHLCCELTRLRQKLA
ncbi:AAA family ATPase [Streptococcus sp. ZJ151]|uniref:AAA family ATPase n=1 Tax=Streptococcus jiangjianxini TaxID=3161189 RepID=UPI0032EE2FE1